MVCAISEAIEMTTFSTRETLCSADVILSILRVGDLIDAVCVAHDSSSDAL